MDIVALLSDPQAWIALFMLTAMEIVLGIDNIVFITILCGRLPQDQELRGRRIGLAAALITRILLLFSLSWVIGLKEPLFELFRVWSGKDLILFGGGLFLIYKAVTEIHEAVEHPKDRFEDTDPTPREKVSFAKVIVQIMILDIVFSLDSVITAVGMTNHIAIMVAAVMIAVGVMMAFAGPIGDFVDRNATIRLLALAFLVMIGGMLLLEGTGTHVNKGYIYSAMAFGLVIELLNMRMRKKKRRWLD